MYHFFAYLSRMKLIERWSLMRTTQKENVQEHSLQVAVISHALALIKNKHFNGTLDPERIAVMAMFHDSTEVLTGDLPTPVKYFSSEIREAYKNVEVHAVDQLLKLLPDDLKKEYRKLLHHESDHEVHQLIKAADTLSAYLKCLEELAAGNREFSKAQRSIGEKLENFRALPEVDYFVKNFVPSFSLTLDEISEPFESKDESLKLQDEWESKSLL